MRYSLVLTVVLASCLLFVPLGQAEDEKGKADRPNFLLVMADDMGYTDIGCFGGEIPTPNIDRIADRGIRFSDFHVSVSCSPTRSMLLSGCDNHVAGLGNMGELLTENQKGKPGYEGHLNRRVVSLAEALKGGGYHTYMAGKWHLGHEPGTLPRDRGFERSFSLLVGGASHWADRYGILPQDDPAKYSRDGEILKELPADFYSSRSYADFLIDAIREGRHDGRPFLAYLAFTAPHDPMHVPDPWLTMHKGRYDEGYEVFKQKRAAAAKAQGLVPQGAPMPDRHPMERAWSSLGDEERALEARGMEVYAGMVECMDYHLGRVVRFLEDIGEYENTVVLFLSDNGANPWYSKQYPGADSPEFTKKFDNSLENLGDPGSNHAYGIGWAAASAGPLFRYKMTVSEGGIRTPLLVAGPGVKGSGRTNPAFAYVTDLMPTLLELAGIDRPAEYGGRTLAPMTGRSLAGVLAGTEVSAYGSEEFVGGEMGGGRWMRQGAYKAVLVPHPYGEGAWELYEVEADPGETRNLATEKPELLKRLQAAWDDYAKRVGVVPMK